MAKAPHDETLRRMLEQMEAAVTFTERDGYEVSVFETREDADKFAASMKYAPPDEDGGV